MKLRNWIKTKRFIFSANLESGVKVLLNCFTEHQFKNAKSIAGGALVIKQLVEKIKL